MQWQLFDHFHKNVIKYSTIIILEQETVPMVPISYFKPWELDMPDPPPPPFNS